MNYDYLYIEVLSLGLLKLKKYKLRIYKIKVGKVTLGKEATNMYRGEYELIKSYRVFMNFTERLRMYRVTPHRIFERF